MIASILAALGMCADGVAEGLYAIRHGFSARAAAVAYGIGAVLAWTGSLVTPVTFTVESITIATRSARDRSQILFIVALSAIPSIILGATGLYSTFVGLLEPAVIAGIIAGVGIILAGVGVSYLRERPVVAGSSTLAGAAAWALTDNLVAVILASVLVGTVAGRAAAATGLAGGAADASEGDDEEDGAPEPHVGLPRFDPAVLVSGPVLIGALSVFFLRTGAVVSYDTVNAELAGVEPSLDLVTLMAGAASLASSLLGGPPLETTPAPMAAAPQPVLSTALFMTLMAGIAAFGLVSRLGALIPLQAIAGFLIVLGIPVIMPEQLPAAVEQPLAGATALAVTALSNPFYGIVVGSIVAALVGMGVIGAGG